MRRAALAATLAAMLGLAGCGAQNQEATAPAPQSQLPAAAEKCKTPTSDDGESITIHTLSKKGVGKKTPADIVCVLEHLDAPDRIPDLMWSTRPVDGMQTDSWGDYEVRWSYHPDNGFFVLVAYKPQK